MYKICGEVHERTNDCNFLPCHHSVCRHRIPEEKSVLLLDSILSSRSLIPTARLGPSSPVIRDVDWRLDVIRKRSESMEPGIVLRIDTSDGLFFVRLPLKAFHKLRFCVAKAFSELTMLGDKVHGN